MFLTKLWNWINKATVFNSPCRYPTSRHW